MGSHWDVIVVGTGATGLVATHKLSQAGLRVLVCEAGPEVDSADLERLLGHPAPAPVIRSQPTQSRRPGFTERTSPFFVDDAEEPFLSTGANDFAWFRSRIVGGRTLTWGGVTIRLSDLDFRAGSIDGDSPDWPISSADLAAHFDDIERLIGVQGNRDGIDHVPDGAFLDPVPFTRAELAFIDAVGQRWPERRPLHGRGIADGPVRQDSSGRLWPAGAAQVLIQNALTSSESVTLATNTVVTSLATDPRTGTVIGVRAVDRVTVEPRELRADIIILCASTIETTRILLNSTSAHHQKGIGNSSDLLGRNLMDHPAATLTGTVPALTLEREEGPPGGPRGFYIPRFRNLPDVPASKFSRGYQMWGHAGRNAQDQSGTTRFMLAICAEMLPNPENRVSLHESLVDKWGAPIPVIHFEYGPNETALMADALDQARMMCEEAGFHITTVDEHFSTIGSYIHEVGTARMGVDSSSSVVDSWNRVWDAPNVLVADGACWPTSANQNPTLTMMAIADRACAGLLARGT